MPPHWSPGLFATALAKIRDAMGLNTAELGRLAGVSRSQASRWGRGAHQPAYARVRQLAAAVYGDFPELAQELMTAAGYPRLTDEDMAEADDDPPAPRDDWERQVLENDYLPDETKRQMIAEWRRARSEAQARRRRRQNGAPATAAG